MLNVIQDEKGLYSMLDVNQQEIIDLAMSIIENNMIEHGVTLDDPEKTKDFLYMRLGALEHEVFTVLFLDNRHRLISVDDMFTGTINGASVHPREVVKRALKHNAAAAILAHNHPSGVPEPSQADRALTDQLKKALDLVDVRVLDHIVIGGTEAVSFAERDWM